MVYADEILDYSGQRKTGVTAGSYGPASDVSPEAGGTITVPQLTVNENGLITGAVERTVTLPSGGGGGGEEQFQQVYTTTLAAETQDVAITPENMGGVYEDIVVCFSTNLPADGNLDAQIFFAGDADYSIFLNSSIYSGENLATMGITNNGGIGYFNAMAYNDGEIDSNSGFMDPSIDIQGIDKIECSYFAGGQQQSFPAGTTITVYARKAVQTGGE